MHRRLTVALLLATSLVSPLISPRGVAWPFDVSGLKTPESFIADPETGLYYISNINGGPLHRDNNGFITQIGKDGKVLSLKFIAGGMPGVTLHAPKGLDIIGPTLYVADIDAVRGFDKVTGRPVVTVDLKAMGAIFLNDLTHDALGTLYVSDTATFGGDIAESKVFTIATRQDHRPHLLVKSRQLAGPNGLAINPANGRLVVVSWDKGSILEVDQKTGRVSVLLDKALGALDGVAYDMDGTLYVSDFKGGRIFRISKDMKRIETFLEGLTTPADINIDQAEHLLLIPQFNADTAKTVPLQ